MTREVSFIIIIYFFVVNSNFILADDLITDIIITANDNRDVAKQTIPGYKLIDVDLNKGAGGKYVYIHFSSKKSERPITNLYLLQGDDTFAPEGYFKNQQNLNEGTAGPHFYLCYLRNAKEGKNIKELKVIEGNNTPMPRGWEKMNGNLNKGTKGAELYLWYRR